MNKLLIFGGSFNPPHVGHTEALFQAARGFSRAIVFPVYQHPYGKSLVSFEHRMAMCKLAFDNIEVSDIEKILTEKTKQKVYSYDVVMYLRQQGIMDDIHLLVGEDVVHDLPNWHKYPDLIKEVTLFPVKRSSISSTRIRKDFENHKHYLLPAVLKYIKENNLYV